MATKIQIKSIYALAGGLGMVERDNEDDPLHQLVYGVTGKYHVSDLTDNEIKAVQHELMERMKLGNRETPLERKRKPKPKPETQPGMMTAAQIGYAWKLMYQLCDLDKSSASAFERMQGVIKKELGITAGDKEPFKWVKIREGAQLIEQLKRYVGNAEYRAAKAKAGVG